jgi:hypothetical protein
MAERRSRLLPCDVLKIGVLPLAELEAQIAAIRGDGRVVALIELLGMRVEVVEDPDHLEIVGLGR